MKRGYVVVELENTDGEETVINVEAGRNYAVGKISDDGVISLVDFSYRSPEEAKAAWPEVDGAATLEGESARLKLEGGRL